ncbi:D(1A) dopamine receptor [Nematostella vectensis]|nr:D(1A) dopamine receptor [Nematostella vectensis]
MNLTINCSENPLSPGCRVTPGQYDTETFASNVFRLTLFSLVILASLIGNCAVVKAIRELPDMRKPLTYYLVTNMAVAELLGSLCLPFLQIYDELKTWIFGSFMCRLVNSLLLLSYFVIPWSLAIIAILRFRVMLTRRIANVHLSCRRLRVMMAIVWLAGVSISLLTFILETQVKSVYDDVSYWCIELFPGETLDNHPSPRLRHFYLTRSLLNFFIPGAIMVIAYGGVASKLKRHIKRNHSREEISMQTSSVLGVTGSGGNSNDTVLIVVSPPPEDGNTGMKDLKKMEHDLLRMIYMIVVIYIGCYIPYQVFFMLEYFRATSWMTWSHFTITRKYAYLLTCFPSALHPICYGTMCKFYANMFSKLILCKK